MNFRWLKRWMPRNLFSRALLILLVPVVGIQLVTAAVFVRRHIEGVTEQMAQAVASELNYAITTIETAPTQAARDAQIETVSGLLNLTVLLDPEGQIAAEDDFAFLDISGNAAAEELRSVIRRDLSVDGVAIDKMLLVEVQTSAGALTALLPRRRLIASNPHLLLTWMIFAAAIFATISTLFLRNQIRPIRELARVSEAFGKGRSEPFRPKGAEEVRRAGAAFLAMRGRLERQIEQRTSMLSGVSHDLRTPLTRMRLALAVAEPGPETDELVHDVTEMERMLDGFLAFARGEGTEETVPVEPITLARTLVDRARRDGADINLIVENETPDECIVQVREMALTRAVQNLLSNAIRYGDRVRLRVRLTRLALEFTVEDDGPGIPEDQMLAALKPFSRLDSARNQDAGGSVGLGLSIAADVARSHGGSLRLERSAALGGLSGILRIPR
ncbi:two-component sensor histidine kinase [Pontivivens ytuae]|uniref:histidine kinase n=1 Tax=Pontivivens ytuae TaxID=2789856 RepID=A0A7S9QF91_9RHOB|nr:two-component sensor histidine kinase [Pontivivens ytuae]